MKNSQDFDISSFFLGILVGIFIEILWLVILSCAGATS